MIEQGHIEEQAAARALGALPPEEEARVDRHADVCPPCKEMLREAEELASLLALTVRPARPSHRCKERLMALIEREQPARAARRVAGLFQAAPLVAIHGRFPAWAPRALTAFALLGLLAWNFGLQRQMTRSRMIQHMVISDHQPTALKPQGTISPRVVARIFQGPDGSDAVLVIENLPAPPPGKVYQVWIANEKYQRKMHTFQVAHTVEQVLMRPGEPLSQYKWVMITLEDVKDSPRPSKTTVLVGDL